MSEILRSRRPQPTFARRVRRRMLLVPPYGKTINTYLPMELMKEIFLYSINESNHMKSGQLASVCRYWRSVITTISRLWSTLRIGSWTETVQVTTWLQRGRPKKVIIDTEGDGHKIYKTLPFAALRDALERTDQWHELTIFSLPPEGLNSWIDLQFAHKMKVLKVLNVAAGCVQSPSFAPLLNLVPTEAPLSELRLYPSFSSAHFLQPHWFPILRNLVVLIISGGDMSEPFELLPSFTQLQIFEADRHRLPSYEHNTNLPLLSTLQKLQLRACSIQWMAGRRFPCLAECTIFPPRQWETIQQHEVQLPSCKKLTYHGHPMTTAQYFHVPEMREMELRSHDCNDKRVYRQLHHLCTLDGWISKVTTLHLALQCSEQAVVNVLKYFSLLQELMLHITRPSPSWQVFLESLAAIPDGNGWLDRGMRVRDLHKWREWCSSRTWHVNSLPYLKYLGIQCPKGFSQSECLDNCPLLRLIGWTRAQLTPPLEHLKLWERRGTTDVIVVDYASTDYLDAHLGVSGEEYDQIVVRGMITKSLFVDNDAIPVFQLHSTILFGQLQELVVSLHYSTNYDIPILPYLEQIKHLEIRDGVIPAYPLQVDLPLTRTLQRLAMVRSTSSWMIGRSFKALREFEFHTRGFVDEFQAGQQGLQMDLPICTTLKWVESGDFLRFLSCPNIRILHFTRLYWWSSIDEAPHTPLANFWRTCSCLQQLEIHIRLSKDVWWTNVLLMFVLYDAREQGVWLHIRSVKAVVRVIDFPVDVFSSKAVGHRQNYEKWWKKFEITKEATELVTINAST